MYLSHKLHPQTISVVVTRSESLGMDAVVGDLKDADFSNRDFAGVLLQYPDTEGNIEDHSALVKEAHTHGVNNFPSIFRTWAESVNNTYIPSYEEEDSGLSTDRPRLFYDEHSGVVLTEIPLRRKVNFYSLHGRT